MRIRYMATIGVTIAASLLVLSASAACGKEDHERIAEDVTREWAMTEAEDISEEKGDHERIAEGVAREWTMNEAEGISEEIGAVATRRYGSPVFVRVACDSNSSYLCRAALGKESYEEKISTAADEGQIRDTIRWEFGPPTRKGDGRYEVIATASISFDIAPSESSDTVREMPDLISLLRSPYTGSVDYELDVDTTSREVSDANMPLASVRISRML